MCGVVGFIDVKKRLPSAVARKYLRAMSKTVVHRGPDDSGVWIDEKNGIYLGPKPELQPVTMAVFPVKSNPRVTSSAVDVAP